MWSASPASSHQKGVEPHHAFGSTPFTDVAAPQTGLPSCQIGDIGRPGTVRGNPRHTL